MADPDIGRDRGRIVHRFSIFHPERDGHPSAPIRIPQTGPAMNYRHIYHAGNFADVLKHAVLTRIIAYLQRKEAAFRVIDTHAGIGVYDLGSEEAQRTGECRDGIAAGWCRAHCRRTPRDCSRPISKPSGR